MTRKLILLSVFSAGIAACTLSVSDNNPKPIGVALASVTTATLNGSTLTMNGTGLGSVTVLSLAPADAPLEILGPIISQTANVLTATVSALVHLPATLLISTASAAEPAQVTLDSLTSLTVDGALTASQGATITGNASISGDTTVSGNLIVTAPSTVNLGRAMVTQPCTSSPCTANCASGSVVTGGGCTVVPSTVGISQSSPATFDPNGTTWVCAATGAVTSITAYAFCARVGN